MTSTFPFPTERHQDEVPPSSVHPTDFDSLTDPALDADNNVQAGKRWRLPDSLTAPTKYRIYRRDAANAAWILEGSWGIEAYLPGQVPVADEDGYLWPADVTGLESGAAGPHASSHAEGGDDEVDVTTLGGYSGDADDVLHGDGSWAPEGGETLLGTLPYFYGATAPVDGDFSWFNQGAASVDTSLGGIRLTMPENTGNNMRGRVKAYPGGAFTLTTYLDAYHVGQDHQDSGLLLRLNSSGAIVQFSIARSSTWQLRVNRWTNGTTFGSTTATVDASNERPRWLRITDDGATNRSFRFSYDGAFWFTILTESRTAHITPDQIGFGANNNNVTHQSLTWLLSWAVT